VRVYGIGPEQAVADADGFVEALDRQGLLAR
jgi:hypothetical protein